MRMSAVATILFLSSVAGPAFAQQPESAPGSNETQTTPVQPDCTPQQSDQARERNRKSALIETGPRNKAATIAWAWTACDSSIWDA
jgi:hypothetical protein